MPHPDGPDLDISPLQPHPEPDDLALVALGEQLGGDVHAHLAGCSVCTTQVESFRSTVELAGLSDYGRDAPPPGEHVWEAISADLGFAGTESADPAAGPATRPRLVPVPDPIEPSSPSEPRGPSGSGGSDEPSGPGAPDAQPAPASAPTSPRRRRNRWIAPIAAAVVGIAAGATAVIVVQNQENSVIVDATAPLTPVPDGPLPPSDGQLGTAELVTARSGQQVRVDAPALPAPATTAYEVWLFGDDGRMVSLGTLADGSGSFTVPAGIDTAEYRTVDVSDEPPDGNPAHSGVSLVRGTFA